MIKGHCDEKSAQCAEMRGYKICASKEGLDISDITELEYHEQKRIHWGGHEDVHVLDGAKCF